LPVKYLRDQRHTGTVAEIAETRFPYPSDAHPELETLTNNPEPSISVGEWEGEPLYPDIVVVRRPGQWLQFMAQIETADSVCDEKAEKFWLPYSEMGDLLLYVPSGQVQEAKRLCRKHNINYKGIRTWRYRPVWGLTITEA
tara:strand:+ start:1470 stop:1892 length:423 start_codon:yes stop_codon:yes gene_type:complete